MIRRHQLNHSLFKPLPKGFAIFPVANTWTALEQRLPVRALLHLSAHRKAVNAGITEEALESRHARRSQPSNLLLVVAYRAAPRHPVHVAPSARGFAFRIKRSHRRRRR